MDIGNKNCFVMFFSHFVWDRLLNTNSLYRFSSSNQSFSLMNKNRSGEKFSAWPLMKKNLDFEDSLENDFWVSFETIDVDLSRLLVLLWIDGDGQPSWGELNWNLWLSEILWSFDDSPFVKVLTFPYFWKTITSEDSDVVAFASR